MSFLARKITLSKWRKVEGEISADSITYCLRTSSNELSLWIVEEENEELIQEVALALASSGDRIDKMDIVLIDDEFFTANDISINSNPGASKVIDLNHKHRDITSLTLDKLVSLTHEISDKIEGIAALTPEQLESHLLIRSFSKKEVVSIIKKAVEDGRIVRSDLSEGILKDLDK